MIYYLCYMKYNFITKKTFIVWRSMGLFENKLNIQNAFNVFCF